MVNIKKAPFYILTFVQTLFFLPFFLQSNIGSDWDAYSLIGTYLIFEESGQYFPSRPPGFPVYELLVGFISKFSFLGIEKSLLLLQYIIMISLNFLIYLFFQKRKDTNILIFIIILFSPIYLISSFTVIDYTFGALFGFLSIYLAQYGSKKYRLFIPLLLAISIGARLSNIVFLIATLISLNQKNIKLAKLFNTLLYTFFLSILFYTPTHLNLFKYLKNLGYKTSELVCILNLTNIDHTLYDRIGRFILKQINYMGFIAFVIFLIAIIISKKQIQQKHYPLVVVFLLFELSFLRLPTEEGHLLPAFIAFMLIIKDFKFHNKFLNLTILFLVISSFFDLKFYTVDVVDSASTAELGVYPSKGYLIEEYELREQVVNKNYHYENSKITLIEAWAEGCPN
ncbi:hypothetical protein N9U45_01500 [Acidimicrobiaceae bacterium]|nr:hypothetical protein [Acidimicrobiaceae bacterium]|tara:strand:+ start:2551 stop:3741 length:1191 start_codon:yes stop_codon:yes gene_type:complete